MNLTTRERSVAAEIARKTREAAHGPNGNGSDTRQYFESLEYVLQHILKTQNAEQAELFLENLMQQLRDSGINIAPAVSTPYTNTIPPEDQPEYPGDAGMERKIRSYIRWNAMAMVVTANRKHDGLGGHISTFASSATLYEVAQNHIYHAETEERHGDLVYFQGHATPGNYARAFLEGRLDVHHLQA